MPRYSKPYSDFVVRLGEVDALRKFALIKEQDDPIANRNDINALCRGSIVLLSSHLEAYIKELGELVLDRLYVRAVDRKDMDTKLFYHLSKRKLEQLRDTSNPESVASKVFNFLANDAEFWSQTGPFPSPVSVEDFNSGFSNPAYKKIKAYFNRFGYQSYENDLKVKLKSDYSATQNMVNHLVDVRNQIAHGDPTATKTPSEVKDTISIVKRYCKTTDDVFGAWCKSKYCSIR